MMDSETIRFIREEVKKQLNVILNAESGINDQQSETINKLFPGMPGINARPVMHPFGFVSRAVQGTISVVAKVGADIQNRMTLGHRDKNRPTDLDEGETCAYSSTGYRIVLKGGMILIGKGSDLEPLIMGETLRQYLIQLNQQMQVEQHMGNLGFQTSYPLNAPEYQNLEAEFLDNKKILPEDGGRF